MHNIDDYAWYEVGDQRYYNKTQALYDHIRYRLPIRWNMNDAEYDQYDWSKEPEQSLESLYVQRAQEIRAKYDYLILHFSGGTDSANILEIFIRHNIHLDEVLIRGSYSKSEIKTGLTSAKDQYGECISQAMPLAQWVKDNHMPHLKITLVDTVDLIYNFYAKNPKWIEQTLWTTTPGDVIKENPNLLDPRYTQMTDQGLKVCHIIGAEKPMIFRHKNYFYTKFLDRIYGQWFLLGNDSDLRPKYIECFYLGKNAILLQIKQLHLLKNYIKKFNLQDKDFDRNALGRAYERWVASILYTRTLPLISEHEKDSYAGIIDSRDHWFAQDQFGDPFVNYRKGIEYISDVTSKLWLNSSSINDGIRGLTSKTRFLGS